MSSLGEFRVSSRGSASGAWSFLLNKLRVMGISDLKPDFSIEDGSGSDPAQCGRAGVGMWGRKTSFFPSYPNFLDKGKIAMEMNTQRHFLAQFLNIKGMGPLAFDMNSNTSNSIWPVSHTYLRENSIQTTLFF